MRVLAPYVRMHPLTDESLTRFAPHAERTDVSHSDTAYIKLLAKAWADGETFLLVEHDIELHHRVMGEAESCCHLWCTWPYARLMPGPHSTWDGERWSAGIPLLTRSLGCTRFSADLMAKMPDMVDQALKAPLCWAGPAGHWSRIDDAVGHTLALAQYPVHVHHPEVKHHHWLDGAGRCSCGNEECPRVA